MPLFLEAHYSIKGSKRTPNVPLTLIHSRKCLKFRLIFWQNYRRMSPELFNNGRLVHFLPKISFQLIRRTPQITSGKIAILHVNEVIKMFGNLSVETFYH